jgi:hypothetical protein
LPPKIIFLLELPQYLQRLSIWWLPVVVEVALRAVEVLVDTALRQGFLLPRVQRIR